MIPIGYVRFTVPYQISFFSDIGGRTMPYYDPELESLWATVFAGARIWGFEYVLAHHFEQNGAIQAFPADTTVVQRVAHDGLIEWSDGLNQPIAGTFFEELKLYGQETIDIHAHYLGFRPGGPSILRGELGLLVESAVMSQAFNPGPNHGLVRNLSAEELAFFGDSLTLDTFDFWELALVAGLPTHRHTWWANTFDPVQGAAITWHSGSFNYEADSPARMAKNRTPKIKRTRESVLSDQDLKIGGETHRCRKRILTRGPLDRCCCLDIGRQGLEASVSIGGGQPPDSEWTSDGAVICGIEIRFDEVKEPLWRKRTLHLPNRGMYSVAFASIEEFLEFKMPRFLISYSR